MTITGTSIFNMNTITPPPKHPLHVFTDNGAADEFHSQFETTLIPLRYYDLMVEWLLDQNFLVAE